MTAGRTPDGDELPVLVGGSRSEPERLLLLSRASGGVVRLREWTSADWAASPTIRESPAEVVIAELERAVKQRRAVNQSIEDVRRWLSREV